VSLDDGASDDFALSSMIWIGGIDIVTPCSRALRKSRSVAASSIWEGSLSRTGRRIIPNPSAETERSGILGNFLYFMALFYTVELTKDKILGQLWWPRYWFIVCILPGYIPNPIRIQYPNSIGS